MKRNEKNALAQKIKKERLFGRMVHSFEEVYSDLCYEFAKEEDFAPSIETATETVLNQYTEDVLTMSCVEDTSIDGDELLDLMYELLIEENSSSSQSIWHDCQSHVKEKDTDRCPSLYELNDISSWC